MTLSLERNDLVDASLDTISISDKKRIIFARDVGIKGVGNRPHSCAKVGIFHFFYRRNIGTCYIYYLKKMKIICMTSRLSPFESEFSPMVDGKFEGVFFDIKPCS